MIEVINKKHQHLPGLRHNGGTVVHIGRPGIFGNPVKIGARCPFCGEVHETGGDTLPCYKRYLWRRMQTDARLIREMHRLLDIHHNGHLLLECWCKPHPCHGDVLRDALLWMDKQPFVEFAMMKLSKPSPREIPVGAK